MYRVIVGIGILAAICFVVGCGSSGGDPTSASETVSTLSKAQFLKQAEAICTKFGDEWKTTLLSVAKEVSGSPKQKEMQGKEAVAQKVAPLLQEEVEELKALTPPARDEVIVTRMLENFAKASQVASSGDLRKTEESGFQRFATEAAAYGLKGCSS